MKHYIVYKITNQINNNIYIGCHTTEKIKDKYFGSGSNIKKAIKKFGIENFEKTILYNFDNKYDMLNKEREIVNEEFIERGDTYNIILGGTGFNTTDTVTVKDKNDNFFRVHKTDPRYLSGELFSIAKGTISAKDKNNNYFRIDCDDERYLSGDLVGVAYGMITAKDKNGKILQIPIDDERYLSGDLVGVTYGTVTVKNKDGKTMKVSTTDPRYLSGELKPYWKGRKHKQETIEKMKKSHKGKHKGEKNSQYGTCWIYNKNLRQNKKIKKDELENWIFNGWFKGRKQGYS
jgi:hypothetical protein